MTFDEWDACVAAGGCLDHPKDLGWGRGKRPVIFVSWNDAKAYVGWLSQRTGNQYRLLSEAEWEYAARAGTTTPFNTGRTITTDQANFDGNYTYGGSAKGDYRGKTLPVGSFSANGFGLHDVHGNVWEWVEDCWHNSYVGAPSDGQAWTSGGDCDRRIRRGGGYIALPRTLRSALRNRLRATQRDAFNGFRVSQQIRVELNSQPPPSSVLDEPAPPNSDVRDAPDHRQENPFFEELKRRRIARIQRGLASLGYNPGPADGIFGPKTRAAIRAFQALAGLPVTGAISDDLEDSLEAVLKSEPRTLTLEEFDAVEVPRALEKTSTGSGFYVSNQGHILTNEHVVNGCVEVRIPPSLLVGVVVHDETNDLAVLKSTSTKTNAVAKFRGGRGIRPGDDIIVVGFPLHGLLTSDPSVTKGNVSALAGPGDDRRYLQITAPVQQGNSGGPLLDLSGNVVGVVVAKLDAIKVANITGDIPQNVNFAISAWTTRAILDAYNVPYETAPSEPRLAARDVAAQAREFTVLVECWK